MKGLQKCDPYQGFGREQQTNADALRSAHRRNAACPVPTGCRSPLEDSAVIGTGSRERPALRTDEFGYPSGCPRQTGGMVMLAVRLSQVRRHARAGRGNIFLKKQTRQAVENTRQRPEIGQNKPNESAGLNRSLDDVRSRPYIRSRRPLSRRQGLQWQVLPPRFSYRLTRHPHSRICNVLRKKASQQPTLYRPAEVDSRELHGGPGRENSNQCERNLARR